MSKRLLLLNLVLVSGAVVFSVQLVRTFLSSPQLPPPPVARPTQPTLPPATQERQSVPLTAYDVVASKNLFNPSRSEAGTASIAPTAKPFLHGVVLRDGAPVAFLEDPATKKVVAYKPGDAVAGGQLERIEADRVVIRRGEGTFEVLLRDPQKPRAVATAPPAAPGARPLTPGVTQAPQPGPTTPAAIPPTLFRRPQMPVAPPVRNAPGS